MFHKKIKNKKIIFFLFSVMLLAGIFGLQKTNTVQAADETLGKCYLRYYDNSISGGLDSGASNATKDFGTITQAACDAAFAASGIKGEINWNPVGQATNTTGQTNQQRSTEPTNGTGGLFHDAIASILLSILYLMGFLISVAASILNWVINPLNMSLVMNNQVVYETWAMVRDTLNIAFILVLLFSAFSTVFQVDKYSYKKLLLSLVLMALLVNFSYPISRFIIDFSNSMMYYLIGGLGLTNTDMFASIAQNANLAKIISPAITSDLMYLLASIIFTWIFAITLLIIAGLFMIRLVALTLLIIFSAVAFTGSIVPFTASYASKWWDNLFKYAFFGPVMIFMLSVAIKMMAAINVAGMSSMANVSSNQSIDSSFVASVAFLSLPIIILWGGIIFAQSMSLAGSGAVIGRGQKFMKWAPNAVWGATGVPGGVKKAKEYYGKKGAPGFLGKIPGLRGSEKTEEAEDRIAGLLTKGTKGWRNADIEREKKVISETRKKWKDNGGATEADIANALNSGNRILQRAAAMEAAEKTGFGSSTGGVDLANYKKALDAVSQNPDMKKAFDAKVKEKNIKLIIQNDINNNSVPANNAYENHLSGLTAEEFAKQKGLHEEIGSNPALQNYIINNSHDNVYHTEFFKRLTRKQREAYINEGLQP